MMPALPLVFGRFDEMSSYAIPSLIRPLLTVAKDLKAFFFRIKKVGEGPVAWHRAKEIRMGTTQLRSEH
jgi:hypothetical protein